MLLSLSLQFAFTYNFFSIPWKMARKKEYSIVDGCAKKRTAPSFSSVENISKTGNNKGNPNALKRKDSVSVIHHFLLFFL